MIRNAPGEHPLQRTGVSWMNDAFGRVADGLLMPAEIATAANRSCTIDEGCRSRRLGEPDNDYSAPFLLSVQFE